MTLHGWDTSIIGVDPARHSRSVLVVGRPDTVVDAPVLEELRRIGWVVTVTTADTNPVDLEALALRHDVALIADIRGTRAVRRALTRSLPTVATVPPRRRSRVAVLLAEAGARRDTTVLIVHDPRDAKLLRRFSGSALVRLTTVTSVRERALALASVLLRAHAWQPAPVRAAAGAPVGADS
jgi:hypothetical protein